MNSNSQDLISIKNMTKNYQDVMALAGVNLTVKTGERFGLIGPDGAGKTTLMRILCGLISQDSGEFSVSGLAGKTQIAAIKEIIGYMPQRFSLYPDLTVKENLRFFSDLFGVAGKERLERETRLMSFSRLSPFLKRRAGALSGGMKQKLALSCALIHTPEVLILDEPTTGVDPVSRREFWEILKELSEQDKTTILVSTPYMDEASRCHRVAFMNRGRILALGTPGDLIQRYPHQVLQVAGAGLFPMRKAFGSVPSSASVCALGDYIRISVDDIDAAASNIKQLMESAGHRDFQIKQVEPLLEDVFVSLLDEKGDSDEFQQ